MKKAFLFVLSICLCAALLIFSGSSNRGLTATDIKETQSAKTAEAASPSPEENTIRIGVPSSKTGLGSTDDARILLGLQYAHSVSPTVDVGSTTYKIELVEADDGGTAAGAKSAAEQVQKQKPAAVIGSFANKMTQTALQSYFSAELPVLSLRCADAVAEKGKTPFFRLGTSDELSGGAAASLAQSLGKTHAAVITDPADAASQALGKAFEDAFSKLGGTSTAFSFSAGKKSDRALAESVQSSGADVVFMVSSAEDGQAFLRQARKEGVLCPVIGPSSWDAGLLLADVDYCSDDVYAVAAYDGCGPDEVASAFAARFSAWAGDGTETMLKNGGSNYASSYSALGYDAYMLLVKAIKTAGSTEPEALAEALRNMDYTGVTGEITFDKARAASRSVAYIKKLNRDRKCFELLRSVEIGGK